MMFTEGLDESAISWIKQGSEAESETRPVPFTEDFDNRYLVPRSPLAYGAGSSHVLPPLIFHSGLLGSHHPGTSGLESSYEDDLDDDKHDAESVASVAMELDSDGCDEDAINEFTVQGNHDEIPGQIEGIYLIQSGGARMSRHASPLNRGFLKENLRIEVPLKSQKRIEAEVSCGLTSKRCSITGGSSRLHEKFQAHSTYATPIGKLNDVMDLRTPSAPPIRDGKRDVLNFDLESGSDEESGFVRGCSHEVNMSKESAHAFVNVGELFTRQNGQSPIHKVTNRKDKAAQVEAERQTGCWNEKSMDYSPCYDTSDQNAWQTFLTYDACIRLCLNAWARGCTEAPEFLRDECILLRRAFGLNKFQLQPQGMQPVERTRKGVHLISSKRKQIVGKIRVEVKRLRIIPQRKLKNVNSWRGIIYMQAGAEYVRHVSSRVKHGINSIKLTPVSLTSEELLTCLVQLKNGIEDDQAETCPAVILVPGKGDYHDFFPESQGDHILIEVQDLKKNVQGQTTIPVSAMVENATDKIRWWPIYQGGDHECIGRVQLSIICTIHDEVPQSKHVSIVETLAYDLLLEAALRSQNFQARNLQIGGHWKWLLTAFAEYYGVSDCYARLRYLSHIMNIATPTKDCLEVLLGLLEPVLKARNEKTLTRQEKSLLLNCETQVESLLSDVFQNYKSLDENSTTGLTDISSGPMFETAAPALAPAVQVYTLLHDILAQDAQGTLKIHLQKAALKRCRKHMLETDEFLSSNSDYFVMDPVTINTAHLRMKQLCMNINSEIQADIKIHNEHILPSSIDLPSITGTIYSSELCKRLRAFLAAWPPSSPASHVTELLIATADFERNLESWNISIVVGGVDSRDLYHNYIIVWIDDLELTLLDNCKAEKVPWSGVITTHNATSPFAEEIYDKLKTMLHEYEVVIYRWPQYTLLLEYAAANVERAIIKALEKQYNEILTPLRSSVPQKLGMQVQKLTRRQSIILYSVPTHLGTFLNTMKRIMDALHCKIEGMLKAWASCLPVNGEKKSTFGEQMNAVTVILRTKYKNYLQAIVVKLVDNMQANRNTRLRRILEETKVSDGEAEIRERMQMLCKQLSDSISNLHEVFTSHIFVAVCRGFWEKMGQIVVRFLESRKENRVWYSGSYHALGVLDDVFASQMQRLQGNALLEKDVEPPRSILEARSILCRDTRNGVESSTYLYF